ncbi:MAG: hypothetical protein KH230_08105 [Enterocloster asparagiformis]|nr:hypothetical protein [Enterocloster asparagiformis]
MGYGYWGQNRAGRGRLRSPGWEMERGAPMDGVGKGAGSRAFRGRY